MCVECHSDNVVMRALQRVDHWRGPKSAAPESMDQSESPSRCVLTDRAECQRKSLTNLLHVLRITSVI